MYHTTDIALTIYKVATSSPLPFLIYNFPAVTAGIDISSDSIVRLAKANPNIVGVKLTCGNLGKLTRIASLLPPTFTTLAGKSDFCLPGLVAGSSGVIAALTNLVPKTHVELLRLWQTGELEKARELQRHLSHADGALVKLGVPGVKSAVERWFGYGTGKSRRPLGEGNANMVAEIEGPLAKVVELEKTV